MARHGAGPHPPGTNPTAATRHPRVSTVTATWRRRWLDLAPPCLDPAPPAAPSHPYVRILVFVTLQPMSRKEKEAGLRSCLKINSKKDVYLTEFASENDYLWLKRVRGCHFCFDSAFPDSTTQAEVYSTSTADLVEGVL